MGISEKALRYLSQSPVLSGVAIEELRALDPPPEVITLRKGETLIRQDERGTDYFVLITGRLQVFHHVDQGGLTPIGQILPGEGVGEMSLLTNEPRTATVIARLDSELVRFRQSTFLSLLERHPSSVLSIARSVIQRTYGQVSNGRKVATYPTIAVLSLSTGADASALAASLAAQLSTYGRTSQVSEARSGELDNLEQQFDFLILSAGPKVTDWSRYCLARADLVLLAVNVLESEIGEFEAMVLSNLKRELTGRIDLLFVHPREWRSHCGAMAWLQRLAPSEHHHIRTANDDDLARVARIIAGAANNVVLSGGGARAFAQIGVLRAFNEFRIPIDRIAGSSMGAAVGALYALGSDFEEMAQRMLTLFHKRQPGKDYTIPMLSLLRGRRMDSIGRRPFRRVAHRGFAASLFLRLVRSGRRTSR